MSDTTIMDTEFPGFLRSPDQIVPTAFDTPVIDWRRG